jgi:hypothetical protein
MPEIGVHGFLDGAHPALCDAAVVAGHQHRPLREGHKDRVVHLELDGQLDLSRAGVEAGGLDVGLEPAQDRGMRV